jgi:hypothetical protein
MATADTTLGQEDSKPLVSVAESALERHLSATIMRGGSKPAIGRTAKGALLAEQGERGHDIYLLLDGVLSVWVDGKRARPRRGRRLRHRRRRAPDRPRRPRVAEQHHREDTDR